MEYLLFVFWLIFFAWLVTKIRFFKKSGLSDPQLIIVLLLKVLAGIFYGWIGIYYGGLAQMADTWGYHYAGIQEYHLLHDNPHEYFTNLFYDPYEGGFLKFFGSTDSYWNDLKGNVLIKILSVFDIFSFGHYWANVIFYSFFTMFGPIAIYRVMKDFFPDKKIPVMLATFLVPSFLYWTSGIHKDGLVFAGIGLVVFCIYFGLKEKKFGISRILSTFIGILLIFVFRNFLLVIIAPALLAWLLSNRWPKKGIAVFSAVYIVFIIFFFAARYINPKLDFPQAVVNKQQDFMKLQGGSAVNMKKLKPTTGSFLQNAPEAFTLSAIRPFPGDVHHILSLAAASEIDLLLLMFIIFLFFKNPNISSRNFIYFCTFFSLSVLLTIGYTVNFLGAIVRYRSIVIPLLVVPMAAMINWNKLSRALFGNIKVKNNVAEV